MRILLQLKVCTRRYSRLQRYWIHICKQQGNQPLKRHRRRKKAQVTIYLLLEPWLAVQQVRLKKKCKKLEQWQPRSIKSVWRDKIKTMDIDKKTTTLKRMKKPIHLQIKQRSRSQLVGTLLEIHNLQKFRSQLYWQIIHIKIEDHLALQQECLRILSQHTKEWTAVQIIRVQVIISLMILWRNQLASRHCN